MLLLLVGVHSPAEGDHRVVAGGVGGGLRLLGDQPLIQLVPSRPDLLGEDARAGVALMSYRQDSHAGRIAGAPFVSAQRYSVGAPRERRLHEPSGTRGA